MGTDNSKVFLNVWAWIVLAISSVGFGAEGKDGSASQWELADAMETAFREGHINDAALEPIISFYKAQAAKGDAKAIYRLGLCYRDGRGVKRDMPQAARLLIKASAGGDRKMLLAACDVACEEAALRTIGADILTPLVEPLKKLSGSGDPAAMARYAGFCMHGRAGVKKDPAEAIRLARLAADKGDPRARWRLGNSLLIGRGVKPDGAKAMVLLKQAAEAGQTQAMTDLARTFLNGDGSDGLKSQGLDYAKQAAAKDNPWATYLLADCYRRGNGVKRDAELAMKWYRQSAQRGYARAMHLLGAALTLEGKGASVQAKSEGFRWLIRAAEVGLAQAMCDTGRCLELGAGVEADPAAAASWYVRAAQADSAEGSYRLALCYFNGTGVKVDLKKAAVMLEWAATKGYPQAQGMLGARLLSGKGVARNAIKGVFMLKQASAGGHADSMYALGLLYHVGGAVKKDPIQAASWLAKADRAGHPSARAYAQKHRLHSNQ